VKALALPADKKIILFNALDVDNTRKGASLLNTALDQLGQNDVVLVRIGGKNGRSRADRTIDTGYIQDPATLAQYYAAADLFVLPSLAENLPNTISESLLCGTPVVAFNVGGIPEQIHENNGVLVDQQSSAGLEVAIKAALGKNWDRSSIAQQAVQRYDRRVIAKAYERLYSGTA
jgi:glycosyltransferase involved in cell wall biosynthesis